METLFKTATDIHEWVLRIEGKEDIPLTGSAYIGRDIEADICIPDDRISRKHARILVSPDGAKLEDLGSCNGTTVNGQRVSKPVKLKSGDKIKLYVIEFSIVDIAKNREKALVLRSNDRDDIPLNGKLSVGRDQTCDLYLDDKRISRKHATISVTASGVVVGDLNSINGTFVNGQKIDRPIIVKAGDSICFHDRKFSVDTASDPDATRLCRFEPEADATRLDRVIVNGDLVKTSSEVDEIITVAKQEVEDLAEHDLPFIDSNKPSAIEMQINKGRSGSEQPLTQLKLGAWVEFENGLGKRKSYCLVSTGEPDNLVYSFAKKTGFGFVKKSRDQVESGLRDGSIRILKKSPTLQKAAIFFGGRLS
jgi:pSer/pThr/pTyr-binding forkhead associated (FHA) protein